MVALKSPPWFAAIARIVTTSARQAGLCLPCNGELHHLTLSRSRSRDPYGMGHKEYAAGRLGRLNLRHWHGSNDSAWARCPSRA
jgi:hypothetical protein